MTPRACDLVVGRWGARFLGQRFPCSVGRGGITTDKTEGDRATPVGRFRLVGGGYRADRRIRPFAGRGPFIMRKIGPHNIWSDDPDDPDYNHGLFAYDHPYRHERLRRANRLYDVFVMTDHNWPDAVPGKGSAIFVHIWRGPRVPTAGCVAFRADHLDWIIRRWQPQGRLVVQV